MRVALEAIVEYYLFEYRLKLSLDVFAIFVVHKIFLPHLFLSGARSTLPMGVAPKAMMGVLAADHRLKTEFIRVVELAFPSFLSFYDVTTENIFFL
jgi:hypothetical protein